MRCPMCGEAFDPCASATSCHACPVFRWSGGRCQQLLRCPRCGYHSLPAEREPAVDPARRAEIPGAAACGLEPSGGAPSRRGPSHEDPSSPGPGRAAPFGLGEGACRLADLGAGARARVVDFDGLDESTCQRLVAYGLTPGARFELLQRLPAYVLQVQQTELALERDVAAAIRVLEEDRRTAS